MPLYPPPLRLCKGKSQEFTSKRGPNMGMKVGIYLTGMPSRWCIRILHNSNTTFSLTLPKSIAHTHVYVCMHAKSQCHYLCNWLCHWLHHYYDVTWWATKLDKHYIPAYQAIVQLMKEYPKMKGHSIKICSILYCTATSKNVDILMLLGDNYGITIKRANELQPHLFTSWDLRPQVFRLAFTDNQAVIMPLNKHHCATS